MANLDFEQERRRLEVLYASMADEELDKLLEAADELTETAREVLQTEIERRGGHVQYETEPAPVEPDHPDLVTIARFRDLPEAMFARGLLQSEGIESFLADEHAVRLDWFWSNAIGRMRLVVRQPDAEAAQQILSQPIADNFELGEGQQSFQQPKCPKCGSTDIQFEGVDRGVALTALAVALPVAVRRDAWTCNACGARWQEVPD